MQRMEANGSVYYVTPTQRVRANAGVYTADNTTITITGDVVAANGQNVLRGDRMVYNTETGQGQMEGGGKGKAKVRPRGVFYPMSTDSNAKSAAQRSPEKSPGDSLEARTLRHSSAADRRGSGRG